MKREDIEKLLGWAREAQKVFEESGETDFEELRRREQREIYDRFVGFGFDVHDDAIDKYTGYASVRNLVFANMLPYKSAASSGKCCGVRVQTPQKRLSEHFLCRYFEQVYDPVSYTHLDV